MNAIKSSCPHCGNVIEISSDLDSIICSSCGTAYMVRRMEGSIGLVAARSDRGHRELPPSALAMPMTKEGEIGRFMAVTDRLGLVEEDIDSVTSDIELIRSKEQGAPLQLGCALFGVFSIVVLLLGFFATVGKSFFGGWLFYLSIAAVILISLKGFNKRVMRPAERRALGVRKTRLEGILKDLHTDQQSLKSELQSLSAPGISGPASNDGV